MNKFPYKGLTNINSMLYSYCKPTSEVGNYINKGGDAVAKSRKGERNRKPKTNFTK